VIFVGQHGQLWDNVNRSFISRVKFPFLKVIRKYVAIIAAVTAGGLGISLMPQAAHAGLAMN
jgi:hypothetical protein